MPTLTRSDIIPALQAAFAPLGYVHAMWQGGSAAFNRVDEYSDIDVHLVTDDDRVDDALALATRTLEALSPIALRYDVPQPTWHGHTQTFFRLRDTSEYALIDLTVMKRSSHEKFIQPEVHGHVSVSFDKSGILQTQPLDPRAEHLRLHKRLQVIRAMFELFFPFVEKELRRGNTIEATAFYYSLVMRPLVEVLRIKHQPKRSVFFARYIHYDLPPEVVKQLEPLFFVANPDDLRAKHQQAGRWFRALFDDINRAD
jgi:hypothetical protein